MVFASYTRSGLIRSHTYILEVKVSDDKVCMCDGVYQGHTEVGILGRPIVRPVLGALDLHLLQQVGEHDHSWNVVVPNQSPEVTDGVW